MRIALAIAVLAVPLAARADEITPKARVFADRGRELHAAGNYAAAIEAFKEAYVIAPSPALLFNLAQAYRLEGDCDDARIMYRRYLASDPPPEGREVAETQLANVERCARDRVPLPAPHLALTVAPAPLPALAPREDEAPASRGELEEHLGLVLAVAGGLALGAAAYYEVQASHAASEVSDAYANGGAGKDIAPIDARGRSAALDAQIFAAGGALALGGGVALYLVGYRAESARPSVAVVPAHGGGRVSMTWAW